MRVQCQILDQQLTQCAKYQSSFVLQAAVDTDSHVDCHSLLCPPDGSLRTVFKAP